MKHPEAANSERSNPSNNQVPKTQLRTNKLVAAGPVFFHDCQQSVAKGELPLFAKNLSVKDRTFTDESGIKLEEIEKRWQLQFSLGVEQKSKLDWVKAHLSGKYPSGVMLEEMLDELLELYLEKHSPERRKERREKRKTSGSSVKASHAASDGVR